MIERRISRLPSKQDLADRTKINDKSRIARRSDLTETVLTDFDSPIVHLSLR